MTTYDQHLEFLRTCASGAGYELAGFVDAMFLEKPALPEEPRYVRGFDDGKAKLEQGKVAA